MLVLWALGGSLASADTVSLDAYRARLREVRSLVLAARSAPTRPRALELVGQAAATLRTTDTIVAADGSTLPVDDSAVAARLAPDDEALGRALADLDARIALADGAAASRLTGAAVDEGLRAVLRPRSVEPQGDGLLWRLLDAIQRAVALVIRSTATSIGPDRARFTAAALGLAIAILVLGILGRGVRERIRREAFVADVRRGATDDPATHLRLADAAIAAGRSRDALHELYLFALAMLAEHETIRYDPALTDRELLARAAAIPQIGPLRALVALHERVWFGLKSADPSDTAHARELAERVTA